MRFTIRCNGSIEGTFEGPTESDAFEHYARNEGYGDFAALLAARDLKRDNFTVEEVA